MKYFVGLFALTSLVNIASVVFFFNKFKQKGLDVGLSTDHVFFKFIAEQESSMYLIMGIALVLSLLVLFVGGFILSHKVAGPLYRLTQHLRSHNEEWGALPRLKFRKGDYFPEIEEEFNRMVSTNE